MARNTVIEEFRRLTGMHALPEGTSCVALCGLQDSGPGSQINQYVASGFMKPEQYIGIDRSEDLIEQNRCNHPGVQFISGQYQRVIASVASKYDTLLYDLDTQSMGTTDEAALWLSQTMRFARPGSVIAFNFMKSNPKNSLKCTVAQTEQTIMRWVPPTTWSAWNQYTRHFPYTSKRVPMHTIIFYRPAALEVPKVA